MAPDIMADNCIQEEVAERMGTCTAYYTCWLSLGSTCYTSLHCKSWLWLVGQNCCCCYCAGSLVYVVSSDEQQLLED